MCSQQAMVTFYRPLSTESNSIMPQLWIEMEWELNRWRNRHPRIIFQHSLSVYDSSRRPDSSLLGHLFWVVKKKKNIPALFLFFPLSEIGIFFLPPSLLLSLRVRLKKEFSFLQTPGKRKDTSLSRVWLRCLKWRSHELFIAAHTTARGGSFSHLVCLSFSRNMFSQTPTLLLVQNSLSRRKTINRTVKPPKHTAAFFYFIQIRTSNNFSFSYVCVGY